MRPMTRLAIVTLFCVCSPAPAQESDRPQRDPGEPPRTTAEEILELIRRRQPADEVIPSAVMSARADRPEANLLPEGLRLVSEPGQCRFEDGWWLFERTSPGHLPDQALRLLPNAVLEAMVRTIVGTDEPIRFQLSGEITVFNEQNYLLPRLAVRDNTQPADHGEDLVPESGGDQPAEVEDVLEWMKSAQPRREIVELPAAGFEPLSPAGETAPLPDNVPLVQRSGRLMQDGAWWTFVLESDRSGPGDLPLRLLPCTGLELMLSARASGHYSPVYVVSGEITAFDGRNYLLVRAVTRRIDPNNLKK